ncbi:MAG: DUF5821 family protein [Halobacteriaceae archaeon]
MRAGDEFNEVSVALLATARNELLLYDLGRWGENVGLASRETFSRKKQLLEEKGIIEGGKKLIRGTAAVAIACIK